MSVETALKLVTIVAPPLIKIFKGSSSKKDIGEFFIIDSRSRDWKVKVREKKSRGRYLKLECKSAKREIRASANGYKPEKYARISLKEWIVCADYALGNESDPSQVESILSRFIN